MSQLKILTSISYINLLVLLCLLIFCISINHVESYSTYDYEINDRDMEILIQPDSSYAIKDYNIRSIIGSNEYDYPSGQIHLVPFKKRTIPIGLQKALYAHGIVGRRRR